MPWKLSGGLGTVIHWADATGKWLDLEVQVGVPEELMPKITRIPFGKGIAGFSERASVVCVGPSRAAQ